MPAGPGQIAGTLTRSEHDQPGDRSAPQGHGGYGAEHAQSLADADARRPKEAKLATNLRLRREVQDRLKLNHSPEQIVARLREDYPDDPEMWVSHETIYQSLYVQAVVV